MLRQHFLVVVVIFLIRSITKIYQYVKLVFGFFFLIKLNSATPITPILYYGDVNKHVDFLSFGSHLMVPVSVTIVTDILLENRQSKFNLNKCSQSSWSEICPMKKDRYRKQRTWFLAPLSITATPISIKNNS